MALTDREPTPGRAIFRSDNLTGGFLAALMSANSITVLCYSSVGSSGNSAFTGVLLATYLTAVLALSFRTHIVISAPDYLFTLFLFCVLASFAMNGHTAEAKEWAIFATSLAAYPACRYLSIPQLREVRPAFSWITGIIVALGAIITAQALIAQWYDLHGKPIVGNFDAAATIFLGSLGLLLIAVSTTHLTMRKTALISGCTSLPVAILAASQVRFTFVAIIGSLCLVAALSRPEQRKYIAIIALVVIVAIFAGLVARHGQTRILLGYVTEETSEKPKSAQNDSAPVEDKSTPTKIVPAPDDEPPPDDKPTIQAIFPPSCILNVDMNNSIAERKALARDALYLIPLAGTFGFGLDGFAQYSCMKGFSVHDSALQAFVEFGWTGGAAITLLVLLSIARLLPMARRDDQAKFVLCSLAYVVALSFAHGRTSRDILLFALLGLTAGISETSSITISGELLGGPQ